MSDQSQFNFVKNIALEIYTVHQHCRKKFFRDGIVDLPI